DMKVTTCASVKTTCATMIRLHFVVFRSLSLLVLLLAIGGAQSAVAQTIKFTSPADFPAGRPFVVSSGDFNGDGKVDLVAGDITNNDLVILPGNGDGTLKAPVTYHLPGRPFFLIASDFNRGEKSDWAFGASPSPAGISILLGKGDGTFEAPVFYAVPAWHMTAADLNHDGKPDIVTGPTTNSLTVSLNNGNGT